MDFLKFITEDGYIMIAVLWIIGEGIKGFKFDSKWILPALTIISVGFTPLLLGGYTPENIVQAVLVAGGAVLIDQTRKQITAAKHQGNDRDIAHKDGSETVGAQYDLRKDDK